MRLDDIDLLDLDRYVRGEHHEMFRVLRSEDPVHWQAEPDGPGFWAVTKLRDLQAVNRDTELFSSEIGGTQRIDLVDVEFDTRGVMLVDTDPPKHTRYRRIVNKGFTPRMIGLLESYLQHLAERIVDEVVEAGECDFVNDLAAELPLQAIAELMGVPQEDRRLIFDWSNTMIGINDPDFVHPDGAASAGMTAAMELYAYSNGLAAQRRDDPRDDLVTKLINADIDGESLSELEFDMFMLLLSVAGNETTRTATAIGMNALMDHPEQMARVVANIDDDAYLMRAMDEVLRWSTPVLHFRRTATADTQVGGREVKKGDKLLIWHVSANRDEEIFDDPFTFDVERSPNDHVAFGGGGAHYCLGANLARVELRIIFREILSRIPDLQKVAEPKVLRSNFVTGLKQMPVKFTPGSRKHPTAA
jgi:cholest-4-en-3-one 26-monooxygenase